MQESEARKSIKKLDGWVQRAGWKAYDTFDGLSSPYARLFTWEHPFLKQVWQQAVRRIPVNLRPVLGIKPEISTKAMGFFARGYLTLYQTYGDSADLEKAIFCLDWLMANRSAGFKGYCWGNHFDYQSRDGNISRGTPTIVWTGLIGHAFLDAFDALGDEQYLAVATSACDFILDELGWLEQGEGVCFQYYPDANILIHNANMIGASLLVRVNSISSRPRYLEMGEQAIRFTVYHQTEEGSWYYGAGKKWGWIDSFHTGYVLEALHTFCRFTGLVEYEEYLHKGYDYFIETFFEADGTPRYYDRKSRPIDIQCASQGIQTLVNLRELHSQSVAVASKVTTWTIANMQDKTGYFYYRKYPLVTNKTPTLHWGQATMFAALSVLVMYLNSNKRTAVGERIRNVTVV